MNAKIVTSKVMTRQFDIVVVPIQLSTNLAEIGTFSVRKLWTVARSAFATFGALWGGRRPDLIYLTLPPHGGGFYSSLPLVLLAKLRGVPTVYHFHGKGIAAAAERSALFRRTFGWALRDAFNIFLSKRLYPDAQAFAPMERSYFLPNFGPERSPPATMHQRSGKHILYLSNLVLSKGPLDLLDSLAILRERKREFRATFTGVPSPPFTKEGFVAEIAARGLQDHVTYVGPIYGEAKQALLESADILAFPSTNDAFPLVVLEAMAAGVAVVATPEGAIPDMVDEGVNGLLVPHRNPAALAGALERLLADPVLTRKMGEAGQSKLAKEFSEDRFFDRLTGIWSHLADGRTRAAPLREKEEQS